MLNIILSFQNNINNIKQSDQILSNIILFNNYHNNFFHKLNKALIYLFLTHLNFMNIISTMCIDKYHIYKIHQILMNIFCCDHQYLFNHLIIF